MQSSRARRAAWTLGDPTTLTQCAPALLQRYSCAWHITKKTAIGGGRARSLLGITRKTDEMRVRRGQSENIGLFSCLAESEARNLGIGRFTRQLSRLALEQIQKYAQTRCRPDSSRRRRESCHWVLELGFPSECQESLSFRCKAILLTCTRTRAGRKRSSAMREILHLALSHSAAGLAQSRCNNLSL